MLWHKMITNIREFSKLSSRSIREICFKFTKEKHYSKSIVIRFGQILDYCYFVEKGSLTVYVWNELTKSAHIFQKISSGGCVNFSNCITGHGSLFIIRTTEESVLLKLKKDDLENLAKKDHEIDEAIKFTKSKYGVNGHKYDFIHKILKVKKSLTDKRKLLRQRS